MKTYKGWLQLNNDSFAECMSGLTTENKAKKSVNFAFD